jgi:tetratricopeptide (TPR) repeat protein
MRFLRTLLVSGGLAASSAALAQSVDVDLDRGPASELYIRKRPAAPAAPVLTPELKKLLLATETRRDEKRIEAIRLLRAFLDSKPSAEARAEGTFKLAELLWEESRRLYLLGMESYEQRLEACKQAKGGCDRPPVEPRIELAESRSLYESILRDAPGFRRTDLVLYLVGFAEKENNQEEQALDSFRRVIEEHPASPLFGDAWMMIGEHHFAQARWEEAREAYANIITRPDAPTYDLAMFKTAWCDWKLGDIDSAARRFKAVLDLAVEAERAGSASQRRRRANLRDEALEYLVVVFTEDRSISAKDVFDFLASIGGERYSKDVLVRVAESYVGQSEYERATDTFAFLIEMDPAAIKAADWQRNIVQNWVTALDAPRVFKETRTLLSSFGPGSAWAKQQRNRDALGRSLATTEELVRTIVTNLHADAQRQEKTARCTISNRQASGGARRCNPAPIVAAYEQVAASYLQYLDAFALVPAAARNVQEVRFLRAEILLFKLGQLEDAGDEYMAVGRSRPVGTRHKDALLKAMEAYEKARPRNTTGKRQLLPIDKKFAEAIDLYATLFPADPELVGVIFRNGQLFFDYGDYDEAIKRFGLIVTRYPKHPDAGPAGDRILDALNKAQDYENIEEWARRLKQAPAFADKAQQERLDRLMIEAIARSGDKYKDAGQYEKAASFYLRIASEFPRHKLAPEKMMNAGVMYESAKQPSQAAETYLALADKFPSSEQAEKAGFAAGQVYERVAYFDRAADAYEKLLSRVNDSAGTSPRLADAVFNAGRLRQALGQYDKAIAHYQLYARRYRSRPDASGVAFNIGVVYEESGEHARAEKAFSDYARTYRQSERRVIEAHLRAGRAAFRQGELKRASGLFDLALRLFRRADGKVKAEARPWAAEARYWQGELLFRDYEKVQLNVKPQLLERSLKKKSELLAKAQAVYLSVVDFEDLKWATAALFRVGQIYDGFAEALVSTPTPQGLSEAEATAYRDALDLYVVEIQDKAIELFAAGYQKAIQMQVYDQHTAKIREALGRLAADKYPPEREARARERIGDRPLDVELVTEVER